MNRIIEGTRYTQHDAAERDQQADFAQALTHRSSHDALMALHAMGYDVSTARVRTV